MSNKTGGPAFPQSGVCTPEINSWDSEDFGGRGLTVRDYFAAKALSGWLASYPESCTHPIVAGNADEVAKHSYMLADAMLRAREAS
ncbi:hypothetical protein [Enterobacter roggenkampii]|uniref:hypothetical protein n=1 Tax=Enterobacter roggenkampii TaxID=1812935 RepID=UPI0020064B79|nr:hypothetical protein [Enterobacter roggenkampii]MCK6916342.1 hypothetical protein [Enterobacter roggenkampii]